MPSLSITGTIRDAFVFSSREFVGVLKCVMLPVVSGGVVLYFLGMAYIAELDRFLVHQDERSASLVLAVAGGGLLVLLFFHAVVVAGVISLALGKPRAEGWKYFHIALPEWRVYAGLLRLVVIAGILVMGGQGVRILLLRYGFDPLLGYFSQMFVFLAMIWLCVRIGFFVGPIGVDRDRGQIIGRAWEISAGRFWRLMMIGIAGVVPGIGLYLLGDYVLQATGLIAVPTTVRTLMDLAGALHQMLASLVILLSLTYLISAVLLSSAAAFAYRSLVDENLPPR